MVQPCSWAYNPWAAACGVTCGCSAPLVIPARNRGIVFPVWSAGRNIALSAWTAASVRRATSTTSAGTALCPSPTPSAGTKVRHRTYTISTDGRALHLPARARKHRHVYRGWGGGTRGRKGGREGAGCEPGRERGTRVHSALVVSSRAEAVPGCSLSETQAGLQRMGNCVRRSLHAWSREGQRGGVMAALLCMKRGVRRSRALPSRSPFCPHGRQLWTSILISVVSSPQQCGTRWMSRMCGSSSSPS